MPTFCDSSSASSSPWSSIAAASPSSASARSPGVVSSHSGSACLAASTARSTSACVPLGTSAIVSPVAGFSTSIVPPSTASTHLPPTKFLCCETVTLMPIPPGGDCDQPTTSGVAEGPSPASAAAQITTGIIVSAITTNDDRVHDRELLSPLDVGEDADRQRLLRAGRERRHDHLVEGEREREQPAGDERRRDHRPDRRTGTSASRRRPGPSTPRRARARCAAAARARCCRRRPRRTSRARSRSSRSRSRARRSTERAAAPCR